MNANRLKQMCRSIFPLSPLILKGLFATAQGTPYPGQPFEGPGGADYSHHSVAFFDAATSADGYWLFEPAAPVPDSAEVVVFLHGYGAYNPMAYGKWIKHLVAKGNIVIYPRYQKNLVWPRPDGFPENAAKAIRDALQVLEQEGHVKPRTEKVAYIAHSVVGEEFGRLVFETAVNTPMRNLIVQRRDTSNFQRWILATHSEPYAYDLDFDTGVRNYTAKRVLMVARLNEVDFYCYWKFSDALLAYTRHGQYGEYAFGNTAPTDRRGPENLT